MPHFLLIALAGAGAWAGYKWVRKEQKRVQAQLREAEEKLRQRDADSIPTLRLDPETGEYVPGEK